MSLPDAYAHFIRLTEDGYPPVERHLGNCRSGLKQGEEWLGDREARATEMLVLPICKTCQWRMEHAKSPEELAKIREEQAIHLVAVQAAGWERPPPIDERKLRYGSGIEVSGGLPSLGENSR